MQSCILYVIILFVGALWFVWKVYGQQLLNKVVWVKNTNPSTLQYHGDIKMNEDLIQVKFLWSIKTFSVLQIAKIKAYSQTNWGLEDHEQVEIILEDGHKIYFSGSLKEHRNIAEAIVSAVGIQNITWAWGFLPQLRDNMRRDIVYEK